MGKEIRTHPLCVLCPHFLFDVSLVAWLLDDLDELGLVLFSQSKFLLELGDFSSGVDSALLDLAMSRAWHWVCHEFINS
jgi:hypothetical protein